MFPSVLGWRKFKRVVRLPVSVSEERPAITTEIPLPNPPFPHLLHSNTPPSDTQVIVIKNVISTVATQSLHLQEHIQEHGLNKKTQCQLDRVHKFVHAHRGVLSAIRRIPPELLQEIFIHTTVGANRWDSIPWALCLVCRSWRIAALSVSSLWNRLPPMYLRCPRMPGSVSSVLAEIRELLVRSRDAPITFYIYAPLRNLCLDSDSIINVLASHSERWQTVSIDSAYLSLFSCKRVKGRLSSLRTLSIHISGAANFADMYEDAPQLREVCLSGIFSQELRLPFSQLTHYKECISGRGMAGHVISLAKSLTTLHLARCYGSADIPVSTLPVLVTLMVEGYEIRSQGFLDNLTLPAIQEIWIAGFRGHLITILTAMIYRSHSPCMLKKLAFRTSEVDSGELTKLLKLTPHLVDLNLPLPPQEDLTNLIIRRNSQPLVPLLQMLTFEPDGMTRTHSQSLNALAVSRSNLQDGLMSRDCRALHELRIVFQPPRVSHSELRFLEDWHESEGSKQLGIWKQGLIQEFPELGDRYRIEQRTLDSGWRDRIFDILSDIKKFKVKNVNDIYISGIHTILRRFTDRQRGKYVLSLFADKAHEILKKWIPLFESHLKDRRWVLKGDFSLVYLPTDDALRTSSNNLDIVYGTDDSARFAEIFCLVQYI